MLTRQHTPTRSHVELTPLSAKTWRVCDDRFKAGDRRHIVGYLQDIDDEFEMLWIRPYPGGIYRYPTMESAIAAIVVRFDRTSFMG